MISVTKKKVVLFSVVMATICVHEQKSFALTKQENMVRAEIEHHHDIIDKEIIDQLIQIAIRSAKKNESLCTELSTLLSAQLPDQMTDLSKLNELETEQKESIINSLSAKSRETIFVTIGERLFDSRYERPFKVPTESPVLSQLDTFFLLAKKLINNIPHFNQLKAICDNCLGAEIWQMTTRFKTLDITLIPESIQTFFNPFFDPIHHPVQAARALTRLKPLNVRRRMLEA
jgi:uncharacterized protein YpiB (UPF0302 family)